MTSPPPPPASLELRVANVGVTLLLTTLVAVGLAGVGLWNVCFTPMGLILLWFGLYGMAQVHGSAFRSSPQAAQMAFGVCLAGSLLMGVMALGGTLVVSDLLTRAHPIERRQIGALLLVWGAMCLLTAGFFRATHLNFQRHVELERWLLQGADITPRSAWRFSLAELLWMLLLVALSLGMARAMLVTHEQVERRLALLIASRQIDLAARHQIADEIPHLRGSQGL